MYFEEVIRIIADVGIFPVLIGLFVWFMYKTKKSDDKTREHNQSLIERQQAEGRRHDEAIMKTVLQMAGKINQVVESVSKYDTNMYGVHTKEEEQANTKTNLMINSLLKKLLTITGANHAFYVVLHNGGKDIGGRYLQRMSIIHEATNKYTVPIMGELQNFPRTFLPATMAALDEVGHRYVNDIEEIKYLDPNAYQLCKPRGVKSFMVQGVETVDKKMIGFLVLEFNCLTDVKSDKKIQKKLRDCAVKISGALEVSDCLPDKSLSNS